MLATPLRKSDHTLQEVRMEATRSKKAYAVAILTVHGGIVAATESGGDQMPYEDDLTLSRPVGL